MSSLVAGSSYKDTNLVRLGLHLYDLTEPLITSFDIFFKFFIYFWLRWVFIAACRLFASCGEQGRLSQLLCGMWDFPRPGIEPISPTLAGRFFNTGQPRKSLNYFFTPIHPYWEVRASTKGCWGRQCSPQHTLRMRKLKLQFTKYTQQ